MGPAVNRQDVQNIVEVARNRIMSNMVTKQDISAITDSIRTLNNLQTQSMQLLKQSEYQQSQLSRRVVALEARLINLEAELRNTHQTMTRVVDQPQRIVVPAQPNTEGQPTTEYVYRPGV